MKTILLAIAAVTLSACATVRPHPNYTEPMVVDVRFEYLKAYDTAFEAHLNFFEWTDMPGVVSEIYMSDRTTHLVEYFETEGGQLNGYDRHSTKQDNLFFHERWVFTYPAEVEGVDFRGTFAELPQNRDGSIVSNTNTTKFNADYHKKYKRKGRVVSDMRDQGIWWYLSYNSRTREFKFTPYKKPSWITD